MTAGAVALAVVLGVYILWRSWGGRVDGRDNPSPVVWDCGRDDCRLRNRANHRHEDG